MIKELRNVLTVRTANKTSLKVKRRRKKFKPKARALSHSQTSDQLNGENTVVDNINERNTNISSDKSTNVQQEDISTNINIQQQDTNIRSWCDTTLHDVQVDISPVTSFDVKDESHDTEVHSQELLLEDTNPLMMRHIAAMAAKMALKQSAGNNKQEEVFGSEQ